MKLRVVNFTVNVTALQQLVVLANANRLTVLQHQNHVGVADGAKLTAPKDLVGMGLCKFKGGGQKFPDKLDAHSGKFGVGMIISEEMEALMYGIIEFNDEEIAESLMPLMYAMHDTLEMEDLEEMRRIILERYNANDPVTWFNRRNIFIL